jgi:hypothetical protein
VTKAPVQSWFGGAAESKLEDAGDFDDEGAVEVIPHQAHNNKKDSGAKNGGSKHSAQEIPIDDDWDLEDE